MCLSRPSVREAQLWTASWQSIPDFVKKKKKKKKKSGASKEKSNKMEVAIFSDTIQTVHAEQKISYFFHPTLLFWNFLNLLKIKVGKKKILPVAQKWSKMARGACLLKRAPITLSETGLLASVLKPMQNAYKCIWKHTHTHAL